MLTIIGTHYYMAPEIFIGGGYDERIDLWALGVTIFKLVTGRTPFESEYHSETVRAIEKATFSFEEKHWDNYSPHLRSFVSLLLKKVDERMSLDQAQKHLWMQ